MRQDSALELFVTHRGALVDYASSIVGSRTHGEDVVQEAWLRFSSTNERKRVGANPIVQPLAYLYRIVRNLALDVASKRRREAWQPGGEEILNLIPADIATPEQEAVDRDQLHALTQALSELPPRTRRAFDLHRFDEKTFLEIAEILGLSQARVYCLVQEAMAHCMERLARQREK